jgi:chaperonin cofactor prefoldin
MDKDTHIKELEEQLQMEIRVKNCEVMLNKELKERAEKLELHIETLLEINEKYSQTIAKLRIKLKELIVKS